MLLQHFTWQQFLVAATILTAVWYVAVILIFYRKKLQDILNGKGQQSAPVERLRHAWEDDYEDEPEPEADDLIGESVLPEGMSKVSMSMFSFAPRVDEPESEAESVDGETSQHFTEVSEAAPKDDESRERQQKLVPDAIEELKTIFHILDRDKGGKEDFISLFGLVKNKYAALRDTPNARALNEFIRENVLFPISDEELINLWN
ncbi:hypothetical protein SNE26_10190 [Mucilaginibacter sp. cycad4]|uniref:hypothetical protein n=1 Tax=Mucilaginibacter sp. cycad4 TaxID=3342096 RepID=UPI002AAC2CC4|nr:hypothetical protein [Mucilaginibacter gossypii]WPV02145.1 hypothetical protein SNE26_10190 [Mucilaginibacter gossypii]